MKAKITSLLLTAGLLLLAIVSTGCMTQHPIQLESADASLGAAGSSAVKTSEERRLDEEVFPQDKIIDVKVTMSSDDFQDMLDNASQEEYKPASVEYNGTTIDNVAIRTKGNLSLRSVVNSDSDRYSFKIAFDEYIGSQNLHGVTKINLNNNYSDPTYMREFLSYELAEKMGLPTPKYSYVRLYVNNELKGLYLAIEQFGTAYLNRNFQNTSGAFYKANGGSGSELTWLGDNARLYTGLDLKSATSNDDILIRMLNELNHGSDLESYIDVDEVLKYIALNVVATNMDSYLGQNKHNYYLYENQGLFNMLPWDYNMAFGGFGGSSVMIDEPTQGQLADRPMIAKLLANEEYKAHYHEIIQGAIQGYLAEANFSARIDALDTLIASDVEQDPTAFYTYEQYKEGLTSLKKTNATTIKSIQDQLDGTAASSGDGSGSGMGGRGGGERPAMAQPSREQAEDGVTTASTVNEAGQLPAAERPANAAQTEEGTQGNIANGNGTEQMPDEGNTQGEAPPANNGAAPPDGAGGMEAPPDGFGGGMGALPDGGNGMERPNGMGRGGAGPGGFSGAAAPQGSAATAITALASALVLGLACLVIVFYKRGRL